MEAEDTEYYRQRAREEREKATQADEDVVAGVHVKLAEQYEQLSRGVLERPSTLEQEASQASS